MDVGQQTVLWRESNPIFKQRTVKGLKVEEVAEGLGVTLDRVTAWEGGYATPDENQMKALGALLGIEDIEGLWRRWLVSKPHIGVMPAR